MAIHLYNTQNENLWNKGSFGAMIRTPGSDRPFGYCDGTPEDEQSLIQMAEGEGLERVRLERKELKTGRQIWTVVGDGGAPGESANGEW